MTWARVRPGDAWVFEIDSFRGVVHTLVVSVSDAPGYDGCLRITFMYTHGNGTVTVEGYVLDSMDQIPGVERYAELMGPETEER